MNGQRNTTVKLSPYLPLRSIPKWEQGRITEEQWTPKPKIIMETNKEEQKRLLTEMMKTDEEYGIYESTPVIEHKDKTTLQGLILRIKQRAYLDTDEEIARWIKEWAINEYAESKQLTWISVKDRLPEVNKNVLVYTGMKSDEYLIGSLNDKGWFWDDEANYISIPVTHWMPLPKPPKP